MDQHEGSEETLHPTIDDNRHIEELRLNQEDVHANAKITGN
jgi:hypothetical protein